MNPERAKLRTRLNIAAAVTLAAGLTAAVVIRLAAVAGEDDVLAEQINSKSYRHDLELYGGKANLLADELLRWFSGLWHGPALALTVACIAGFASLVLFFVARHLGTGDRSADDGPA